MRMKTLNGAAVVKIGRPSIFIWLLLLLNWIVNYS